MSTAADRTALRATLGELLRSALATGDAAALSAFLMEHSNLPGPRGNLELAADFARLVAEQPPGSWEPAWALCQAWTDIDGTTAPVGDPAEYLPFCGAWALGNLAAANEHRVPEALDRLRHLAADGRWRLREAVANGLQALLTAQTEATLAALATWIRPGAWLEMRAVAAGLAEPTLLQDAALAEAAVALHHRILDALARADDRGHEFRILRQGLGYTVSVVAVGNPEGGTDLLERLAASSDPDLRWILRETLKKNRLHRAYPDLVRRLAATSS